MTTDFVSGWCTKITTIYSPEIVSGDSPPTEKEEGSCLPLSFSCLVSLGSQNLTTIVVAASLASSVRHDGLTTLGANRNAGSGQLPVGTAALIAAGLGHFTLRDSHG
jgi:hypothetical protein